MSPIERNVNPRKNTDTPIACVELAPNCDPPFSQLDSRQVPPVLSGVNSLRPLCLRRFICEPENSRARRLRVAHTNTRFLLGRDCTSLIS